MDPLADLRGYFTRYEGLLDPASTTSIELDSLRATIAQAHRSYQAARYEAAISQITPMLTSVDQATRGTTCWDRELLLGYVSAYVVTAKLLTTIRGPRRDTILAAARAGHDLAQVDAALDEHGQPRARVARVIEYDVPDRTGNGTGELIALLSTIHLHAMTPHAA